MGFFSKKEDVKNDLTPEDHIRKLEDEIYDINVNHILHFILSLLTAGFWAIIWIILFIDANSKKKRLQRLIDVEYRMLSVKNKSDNT
jgi:hypothetical protein